MQEIAGIAPKLNLTDDPKLNEFAKEMEALVKFSPDTLRKSEGSRKEAATKAQELMDKLSGYKL